MAAVQAVSTLGVHLRTMQLAMADSHLELKTHQGRHTFVGSCLHVCKHFLATNHNCRGLLLSHVPTSDLQEIS